jgi:hypothetical protein
MKYEYDQYYFGAHEMPKREWNKLLHELGDSGWELVQIIIEKFHHNYEDSNYTFIVKRQY